MEGITNDTLAASWGGALRAVDNTPQGIKLAKLSAELATSTPASPTASPSPSASTTLKSPTARDPSEVRMHFLRRLTQRYYSIIGAWRELDPQQHGRISFFDFCRACRHMGCDGEARPLWEVLDANGDGFVTLEEIDPDCAELLQPFAETLQQTCGSAEKAWTQHFCAHHFGRCEYPKFLRACQKIGFEGDASAVYSALDVDKASTGIAFGDFLLFDRWFKAAPTGRWNYHTLRPVHASST